MEWIVLLAVVAVIAALIAGKLKPLGSKNDAYPYTKHRSLFSPAERSFLGVIERAVGDDFRIYGKVRIADVAGVKRMQDRKLWQRAFNRISAKHFDFVLCDKENLTIVAALELDDKSHKQRKREDRDRFVEGLCAAISLPFVQIPAQRTYSVTEIQDQILSAIRGSQRPVAASAQIKVDVFENPPVEKEQPKIKGALDKAVEFSESALATEPPACPKCSSPMKQRIGKSGEMLGKKFWGCSTFPKCRQIIKLNE